MTTCTTTISDVRTAHGVNLELRMIWKKTFTIVIKDYEEVNKTFGSTKGV